VPALLALALAAPAVAAGPQPPAAAARLRAGDTALAELDLARATTEYRAARELAPESYEAAWKLGRALADGALLAGDGSTGRGLAGEAAAQARDAVRLSPAGAEGHTVLAVALGRLALAAGGRRKVELSREVKTEAELALAADPGADVALHVLGVWNREMATLNPILRAVATWLYGSLPEASLEEALADLRRAVELRPGALAHRVELGVTLAAAGRPQEARAVLEAALALPDGWVTDPHYRERGRRALARLRPAAAPEAGR